MRALVCLCSLAALLSAAPLENILSEAQRQELGLKHQQAIAESDYLKRSWISPLVVQGAYQQSQSRFDQIQSDRTYTTIGARIDQDIFRSGGILAAQRYADALKEASLIGVQSELQGRLAEAYGLLFGIWRLEAQIEKQQLLAANARIEVQRKQERFDQGVIDSSLLHRALLDRNALSAGILELKESLDRTKSAFLELSDRAIESIAPPALKLPDKEAFLGGALALQAARSQRHAAGHYTTMIASQYRPRLSVGASYQHYLEDDTPPAQGGAQQSAYGWGLTLTVPLDLKGRYESQGVRLEAKIAQKRQHLAHQEQVRHYVQTRTRLAHLDRQIALAQEDIELYGALLAQTVKRIEAGSQTEDDRVVMANAKAAREIDLRLYTLSYQEALVMLHLRSSGAL